VPLPQLLTQLQTLYAQTETATESFNKAKEAADQQRTKAEQVDAQLADQRVAVAQSRDQLGLMARQMYQDGTVSPYLSMLTGQTPQDFFGQRHVMDRAAGHQQDVLDELTSGEERLTVLNAQAQQALDKAQQAQAALAVRKTGVETRLRQVESVLAGLTGVQIGELQSLEEKGVNKAQQDLLDSKALGDDINRRTPSTAGERAISYAFMQLGKPYVWGAEGPGAFDCSGLTSQAWAHAGVTVPRTSQEQWAQLPKVPLELLRPGDLVVYFSGASHVAIYIGNGLVIQAPRPGSYVKVSPIAANPILGAVRPDVGDQPVQNYTLPKIPAKAEKPTPFAPQAPAPTTRAVTPAPPGNTAPGKVGSPPDATKATPKPTATSAPTPTPGVTVTPTAAPTATATTTPTTPAATGSPSPGGS
jgi:cell wall-associated NlpC family hydrolase